MIEALLYLLVIGACAWIALFGDIAKSPLYWLLVPWVIVSAPVVLGVISYSRPAIGPQVPVFVLTQLLAIGLGYLFVHLAYNRRLAGHQSERHALLSDRKEEFASLSSVITFSVVLGVMGALLIVIDGYFVSGFAAQSNALDVRMSFINAEVSNVGRLAPMLGWGGFVALLALIWFGPSILKRRTKFYVLGAFMVSVFSILTAGRQALFQLLLFAVIGWLVQRPSSQPGTVRSVSIGRLIVIAPLFSVTIFSMVSLIVSRSSTQITNQLGYLLLIFGATLNPGFENFIAGFGDSISAAIAGTLLYFSSQLSSLAAVIDPAASETWGIGHGGLQFPWLYRRFEFLGIQSIEDFMSIRRAYLRQAGSMSHSWSTSLGNFVNDFGLYGSYVYSFIVGIFGGYAYKNHRMKRSFFSFCILVSSYLYLFYLIMIPASSDTLFFFFVVTIMIYDQVFYRRLMVRRRIKLDQLISTAPRNS